MTINGVHYDEKTVVGMTRNQFIMQQKHGSPHIKDKELGEHYDKIVKDTNANDSKPSTGGPTDGPK